MDKSYILKWAYIKQSPMVVFLFLLLISIMFLFIIITDSTSLEKLAVVASFFIPISFYGMGFLDYWMTSLHRRNVLTHILVITGLMICPLLFILKLNWLLWCLFFLVNTTLLIRLYINKYIIQLESHIDAGIDDTEETSSDGPDVTGF